MLSSFLFASLLCVALVNTARASELTVADTLFEAVASDGLE